MKKYNHLLCLIGLMFLSPIFLRGQDLSKILDDMLEKEMSLKSYKFFVQVQHNNPAMPIQQEAWFYKHKETIVQKDANFIVWDTPDKKIVVMHKTKEIYVIKQQRVKPNNKNSIYLVDSVSFFARKAQLVETNNNRQLHYQVTAPNQIIDFYYYQGDIFFNKLVVTTSNGIQQIRTITNFSTKVTEPYLDESYYIIKKGKTYQVTSYFSSYKLIIADHAL